MTIIGDATDLSGSQTLAQLGDADSPDVLEVLMKANHPQEALEALCAFAESKTKDEDTLYTFRLVCDEFLVNIASYAYGEGNGPVYAAVDARDGLKVFLMDKGIKFNPLEDAKSPDIDAPLDEREIGGCGIMLSRSFAKKLEYRREGLWNITIAEIA